MRQVRRFTLTRLWDPGKAILESEERRKAAIGILRAAPQRVSARRAPAGSAARQNLRRRVGR